jgi:hypothetical protein
LKRHPLFAGVLLATLVVSASAGAQIASAGATADALFQAGKQLRDAGRLAEACASFAESQRMATGIGVTLYLGDCYERLGRPGNAWIEFDYAATLALARHDPRVEVARARAGALEPRVGRLAFEGPPADSAGSTLEVDGVPVPAALWRKELVLDPGDHSVAFTTQGGARSVQSTHLDAGGRVTVRLEASPARPPAAEAPKVAPPPVAPPPAVPRADREEGRRWLQLGLLGAGVASVGVGAALLAVKNDSWSNGTQTSGTRVDPVAAAASKIAFAAGGAAVVAAVVLYLVAPREGSGSVAVAPAPLTGGGGALLRASF